MLEFYIFIELRSLGFMQNFTKRCGWPLNRNCDHHSPHSIIDQFAQQIVRYFRDYEYLRLVYRVNKYSQWNYQNVFNMKCSQNDQTNQARLLEESNRNEFEIDMFREKNPGHISFIQRGRRRFNLKVSLILV